MGVGQDHGHTLGSLPGHHLREPERPSGIPTGSSPNNRTMKGQSPGFCSSSHARARVVCVAATDTALCEVLLTGSFGKKSKTASGKGSGGWGLKTDYCHSTFSSLPACGDASENQTHGRYYIVRISTLIPVQIYFLFLAPRVQGVLVTFASLL